MNNIEFGYPYFGNPRIRFSIEYAPPISIICGESAVGKTYMFNTLRLILAKYMMQVEQDESMYHGRIWLLDENSGLPEFEQYSKEPNSLMFIDNYDHLAAIYGDKLLDILYARKCHLLLSSRSSLGFKCNENQKLYSQFSGNTIKFSPRGGI